MAIFREQRRQAGRWIMDRLRSLKNRLVSPSPLPDVDHLPKTILIIRPFFLGDILLCLPLAQAIKQKNPNARLIWLLREEWRELLEGHSVADEVISFSAAKMHSFRALSEFFRVAKELRKRSIDLVLNLTWDRAGVLWSWISGAPICLGIEEYGRPRLISLLYTATILAPKRSEDSRHMADFYYEPLKLLGFSDRTETPRVSPCTEELESVNLFLESFGKDEQPFVLIHPGGRLKNKRWAPEHFAAILRMLGEKTPYSVVLVCGPGEESWVAEMTADLPAGRGLFWPKPSLGEFMALAGKAFLFLGNDSGPMHLAAASGCRVISIFGKPSIRWRPVGEGHRVIENSQGMQHVTVDQVWDQLHRMLS